MRCFILLLIVLASIIAQGEYLEVYDSFSSPLPGGNVYRVMVFNDTLVLENTLSESDVRYCEKCPAEATIYNVSIMVYPGPFKLVYKNYSCPFNLDSKEKVYLEHKFYVPGPLGPDSSAPLGNYSIKYKVGYWVWEWSKNNITKKQKTITIKWAEEQDIGNNTTVKYVYIVKASFYSPQHKGDSFTVEVKGSWNSSAESITVKVSYASKTKSVTIRKGERKSVTFTATTNSSITVKIGSHKGSKTLRVVPKYVKTKVYYTQELTVPLTATPRNITYILTACDIDDKQLRVHVGLPSWPRWVIGNYTLLNVSIGQYLAENITVRIQVENLTVNGSKLLFYHTEPSIPLKHKFKPLYNNESITLTGEIVWDLLAIYGAITIEVKVEDDVHGEQVLTSRIPLYCNCSWLILRVVDDYGKPLQGVEVLVDGARFLTGPSGTIYYFNRPPGRCLNISLSYSKYRLHLTNLCPVTVLEETVVIDTHEPVIEYQWNSWNRFLTVSVSDRTRIKTIAITYDNRTINYAPMMGNYTLGVWIPRKHNGTITITAEDVYNNTNTIIVKVEPAEGFRLGLKESIILTVLAGTLAFLAYMARRMQLI